MAAKEDSTKVVLLGDAGVGKTTMFTRFKTGKYMESKGGATSRDCECTKTLTVDGKETTITLYDTAGMERHQGTIPPTYFRSAKVAIFVYSIANQESINNIESWIDSVHPQRLQYVGHTGNITCILVGNKSDLKSKLKNDEIVDLGQGKNAADNHEIEVFSEISALDGTEFDELFEAIVREIRKNSPEKEEHKNTIDLPSSNNTSGSGVRCCGKT